MNTTRERMLALKAWITKELCKGRLMKTEGENVLEVKWQEPRCYCGFWPAWPERDGAMDRVVANTIPGILIMPGVGNVMYVEEKRFDRYNNVRRPKELGQSFPVTLLFAVYEDGIREPGYIPAMEDGAPRNDLRLDGTEEGMFALSDWIDECKAKLLAVRHIPGADLAVNTDSMTYGLYEDQNFMVDKRPIYYGTLVVAFDTYAADWGESALENALK